MEDTDWKLANPMKQLEASVLASIIGDTTIHISRRAEHHGPSGDGTLAILARTPDKRHFVTGI